MHHTRILIPMILALSTTTLWSAPPAPHPAPPDPLTKDLLTRLNSSDPAQRAAAQTELAAIANVWRQPDLVAKMIDATPDQELQNLLRDRLGDLKAQHMLQDIMNLPPISLTIKDAPLSDVAAALNSALQGPVAIQANSNNGMPVTYTLDVRNKPFWEVFAALTLQQPLTFATYNGDLRLAPGGSPLRNFVVSGPAMAFVNSITYQRNINFQAANGPPPAQASMTAQVTIAIDPRVEVARLNSPTLTRAVDDQGHNLQMGAGGPIYNSGGNSLSFNLPLQPLDNPGKTMNLVLDGRVTAVASDLVGTLKDLENSRNASITVGSCTVTVQQFVVNTSGYISLSLSSNAQSAGPNGPLWPTALIYDSKGTQVGAFLLRGGMGTSLNASGSVGPYKLEVRVPNKTVEIPLHFEFKDVLLPSAEPAPGAPNGALP